MRELRLIVLVFLLTLISTPSTNADVYTQPLSWNLPFVQSPFFVENAVVQSESFAPHVKYWRPTQANVVGVVTYKFDVPFSIDSASLSSAVTAYTLGSDANLDPNAETYLEVSIDNTTWTTIASQTNQNAQFSGIEGPWDISPIVAGSNVVYARARMLMTVDLGFGTSQFMRQGAPYPGWAFSASTVPESSPVIVFVGVSVGLVWRRMTVSARSKLRDETRRNS